LRPNAHNAKRKARLMREYPKNSAQFAEASAGILCQASYPKLG